MRVWLKSCKGPTSTNSAEHTTKITHGRPGESGLLVCDMLGGEFRLSAEKKAFQHVINIVIWLQFG